MHVSVTRSGGFAGLVRTASVDEADAPEEVRELLAMLDGGQPAAPLAGEPDRFSYTIEVPGRGSATLAESQLTAAQRAALERLLV